MLCFHLLQPKGLVTAAEFDPVTRKGVYHIRDGHSGGEERAAVLRRFLPAAGLAPRAFSNKGRQSDHLMPPPG